MIVSGCEDHHEMTPIVNQVLRISSFDALRVRVTSCKLGAVCAPLLLFQRTQFLHYCMRAASQNQGINERKLGASSLQDWQINLKQCFDIRRCSY